MLVHQIAEFTGEYTFLSNFYPCNIRFEGFDYPSVEHAYQASKTLNDKERTYIRNLKFAGQAKKAGKKVCKRPDWESMKLEVMEEFLRQKFSDPVLRDKLLLTGDSTLIEGNEWKDKFWGVYRGNGSNYLGKLLMHIRSEIISDS